MRRYWNLLIVLLSLHWLITVGHAEESLRVNSLRYWTTPDQSRITLDVSASANLNKVQFFENPARLVIDLPNAVAAKELAPPPASHPLFSSIRVGTRNGTDLRIVIDLKKPLSTKTTTLRTDVLGNNRFVVELLDKGLSNQLAKIDSKIELKSASKIQPVAAIVVEKIPQKIIPIAKATPEIEIKNPVAKLIPVQNTEIIKSKTAKPFVVAIDAGHGGNDSGAQGSGGTYEKDVVLAISKKLEALVNAQTGMKAVMIRQGDYYVGLRKRMDKIGRAHV